MALEIKHDEFEVDYPKMPIKCIVSSSASYPQSSPLIFTHGAGGTLNSDAVVNFRNGFAKIAPVISFQGNMNLSSRVKMFNAIIKHQDADSKPTALGGRSMGARAAVLAAKEKTEITQLVLISYPLHTEKEVRDEILLGIKKSVKVLFISGDNDSMCDLERLQEVRGRMATKSWMVTVKNSDHGLNVKPKVATKLVGEMVGEVTAKWIQECSESLTVGTIGWNEDDDLAAWSGWEVGAIEGKDDNAGKKTSKRKHSKVEDVPEQKKGRKQRKK